MTIMRLLVLLGILPLGGLAVAGEAEPTGDETVFVREFDPDRQLVVMRGPGRQPEALEALRGGRSLDQVRSVFEVRVELRSTGQPPIGIASRIVWDPAHGEPFGFHVLDLLVLDGQIVIASGEYRGLTLWRLQAFGYETRTTTLRDWKANPAHKPMNRRNTGVTLALLPSGQITIEVVDRSLGPPHLHTVFEQKADTWEFAVVRQWREDALPTTSPATEPTPK
jgi:hypothetical protein